MLMGLVWGMVCDRGHGSNFCYISTPQPLALEV
jgi:hypothetical protein